MEEIVIKKSPLTPLFQRGGQKVPTRLHEDPELL